VIDRLSGDQRTVRPQCVGESGKTCSGLPPFSGITAVAQRHREIGLRVPLGATYSRLVSLMLRQALVLAVLGIVVGTVGALAGSRLLAAFLFGVPATDAATFSAAISVFFCAAFVAAFVPALRSFRVDPASALRHE
jgi:putative ABC transport system permease protein